MTTTRRNASRRQGWLALVPVVFAFAVTLYVGLRYGYRTGETDTTAFTGFVQTVLAQHTIVPSGNVYPHGYAYQTLAATLVLVTGLNVMQVLLVLLPFLALATALIAFVTFRRLTGSELLGSIAALLLFIQPEFLFVIERGNHEKVTDALVLTLVFLLVASFQAEHRLASLVVLIVAFYLCAWCLITTNAFFGSSFMAGLALSLVGGLVMLCLSRSRASETAGSASLRRLIYTLLAGLVLVFVFITDLYAPARYNLNLFHTLIQKLELLFLTIEPAGTPYATLSSGYVAPWVYPLLSTFNWIVLAGAGATWIWLALRFKRQGVGTKGRPLFLLWLMAAAFAVEVGVSAVIDLAGFLGDNLEVRLFPIFMLFGIPLAVIGAARLCPRIPAGLPRRVALVGGLLLLGSVTITSVLKATNDPLVSNKWIFATRDEMRALTWSGHYLGGQTVWAGFDERLTTVAVVQDLPTSSPPNVHYQTGVPTMDARYTIASEVIARRSLRLDIPASDVLEDDRIFDDGSAQLYHRVPVTPYQP